MHTGEDVGATVQLERARSSLGEALGRIQDVRSEHLNIEKISETLAGSVREIFSAQNVGILEPLALAHLISAMDHLRTTLELMQEAIDESPHIQYATETVARTLAILYPVVCSLEKIEEFKALEASQQMSPYLPPETPPAAAPSPVAAPVAPASPAAPPVSAPLSMQGPTEEETPFDPRTTQTRIKSIPPRPPSTPDSTAPEDYLPPRRTASSSAGQYHKAGDDTESAVAIGAMKLSRKPVPRHRPSRSPSVPPPGVDERRRLPRRTIEADIGMQSGTNFFTGFSLDISSGGLYISTYDTLPMGASVNVNFDLPGGPVMSLNGLVQWVREYNPAIPDMEPGIGVKFVGLSDQDQQVLNRYIAENPPIFYEED